MKTTNLRVKLSEFFYGKYYSYAIWSWLPLIPLHLYNTKRLLLKKDNIPDKFQHRNRKSFVYIYQYIRLFFRWISITQLILFNLLANLLVLLQWYIIIK